MTSKNNSLGSRIHFLRYIALLLVLVTSWSATAVLAGDFPSRPVTVVMPWGDGFPANVTRLYAQALAKRLGQPVVVETRPGAGGEIAARLVSSATNDGYTLLATGTSIAIRPVLEAKSVDPLSDLQPLALLATTPYVIVAKAGRFRDFGQFLRSARGAPGKLNYASAGVSTGMHLVGELINTNAGIDLVHVPYASGSRQLQALRSGDVDVAVISLVTALPHITSGSLDALVVSTAHRSASLPNTPTLAESGVRGIPPAGAWISLFAPRNLPPAVAKRLGADIQASARDSQVSGALTTWGAEVGDVSPEHLVNVIKSESSAWRRVVQGKNITIE